MKMEQSNSGDIETFNEISENILLELKDKTYERIMELQILYHEKILENTSSNTTSSLKQPNYVFDDITNLTNNFEKLVGKNKTYNDLKEYINSSVQESREKILSKTYNHYEVVIKFTVVETVLSDSMIINIITYYITLCFDYYYEHAKICEGDLTMLEKNSERRINNKVDMSKIRKIIISNMDKDLYVDLIPLIYININNYISGFCKDPSIKFLITPYGSTNIGLTNTSFVNKRIFCFSNHFCSYPHGDFYTPIENLFHDIEHYKDFCMEQREGKYDLVSLKYSFLFFDRFFNFLKEKQIYENDVKQLKRQFELFFFMFLHELFLYNKETLNFHEALDMNFIESCINNFRLSNKISNPEDIILLYPIPYRFIIPIVDGNIIIKPAPLWVYLKIMGLFIYYCNNLFINFLESIDKPFNSNIEEEEMKINIDIFFNKYKEINFSNIDNTKISSTAEKIKIIDDTQQIENYILQVKKLFTGKNNVENTLVSINYGDNQTEISYTDVVNFIKKYKKFPFSKHEINRFKNQTIVTGGDGSDDMDPILFHTDSGNQGHNPYVGIDTNTTGGNKTRKYKKKEKSRNKKRISKRKEKAEKKQKQKTKNKKQKIKNKKIKK